MMGGGGVELFPYNLSGSRGCFEFLGNLVICVSDIKFTASRFPDAMFLNVSSFHFFYFLGKMLLRK